MKAILKGNWQGVYFMCFLFILNSNCLSKFVSEILHRSGWKILPPALNILFTDALVGTAVLYRINIIFISSFGNAEGCTCLQPDFERKYSRRTSFGTLEFLWTMGPLSSSWSLSSDKNYSSTEPLLSVAPKSPCLCCSLLNTNNILVSASSALSFLTDIFGGLRL